MYIEVRHMAAVVALARHRHFQKAAEELGTSQPALSRVIRMLEEEVGECLFDRRGRRVVPTPVGEHFIAFAEDMTRWRARKLEDIQMLVAARRGLVVIACLPSLAGEVAALVGRFCAERPQVSVRLMESPANTVLATVRSGAADLGLGVLADGGEFIAHPFRDDALMAVGAAKNPLMAQKKLHWKSLHDARFIAINHGSSMRACVEQAFARHGVPMEPILEVNLMSTAKSLVAANHGVAVLPSSFVDGIGGELDLCAKLLHPKVCRQISLFRRKDRNLLPAALDMESYLLDKRPANAKYQK